MKQSDALKDIISNLYKLFGREAVEDAIVEARTDLAYEEIAKMERSANEDIENMIKAAWISCWM